MSKARVKSMQCRWCGNPATHCIDGVPECCACVDSKIEHSAYSVADQGLLAMIGSRQRMIESRVKFGRLLPAARLSEEEKKRIVELKSKGLSRRQISIQMEVSEKSVAKYSRAGR